MSPEFQFLLAAAQREASDRVRPLEAEEIDWQGVIDLAEIHGLLPILYRRLVSGGMAVEVPPDVIEGLAAGNRRNAGRNLVMAAELLRLVGILSEAGIRVLTFKGPSLALLAYGDLSLRQFNDLDLLVAPDDFDRANQLIKAAGYHLRHDLSPGQEAYRIRSSGQLLYRDDHGLLVELHSRLTNWSLHPSLFQFDELWSRRQVVELAGGQVDTFGNEDLLLYLMLHGGKHHWSFLIWLCDCGDFIERQPEMNWQVLVDRARAARCERIVAVAVVMLGDVLGFQAPAQLRGRIADDAVVTWLAEECSRSLTSDHGSTAIGRAKLDFRIRDRKRDGARMVLSQLFEPQISDWDAVDLPDRFLSLHFLLRPLRLVSARLRLGRGEKVQESHES